MKVLSGSVHLTSGNYVTAITEKIKILNNHNITRLFRASSKYQWQFKIYFEKRKKKCMSAL